MNRDAAFGGLTLALAAGYYLLAGGIPDTALADAVGPAGLPRAYAVILAGLSVILIARSTAPLTPQGQEAGVAPSPSVSRSRWRTAGMLLIGILYVVVVPWLGYLLSIAALIAGTTYYQGGVMSRRVLLVAVSGAVFFWFLFVMILSIQQPPGVWPAVF
jgi:hypothetical protein